jgi:hypothetical protein
MIMEARYLDDRVHLSRMRRTDYRDRGGGGAQAVQTDKTVYMLSLPQKVKNKNVD